MSDFVEPDEEKKAKTPRGRFEIFNKIIASAHGSPGIPTTINIIFLGKISFRDNVKVLKTKQKNKNKNKNKKKGFASYQCHLHRL